MPQSIAIVVGLSSERFGEFLGGSLAVARAGLCYKISVSYSQFQQMLTGRRRRQWPGDGFRLVEFHVGRSTNSEG
jgi:hypothetical protein